MTIMERLRYSGLKPRHKAFAVLVAAIGLGALFLALVLVLGSCQAKVVGDLRQDGSARLDFKAEIPAAIAAKLRKLGGGTATATAPLFDAKSLRSSIAAKPYLGLIELSQPSPESIKGAILVRSLAAAASSPDFAKTGTIAYSTGAGWAELSFKLDRSKAEAVRSLAPGLDPDLLEALSPPALDEEGLSAAEYRTMLKSVLGEKAMPAMEAATIELALTAPGAALSSKGGSLDGSTLSVKIPLIDLLVLEKPIEFGLRWKQ
jgi:hypothetical protein